MITYLLDLIYQAEKVLTKVEIDNQLLDSSLHSVSDEMYSIKQMIETHFDEGGQLKNK